MPSNSNITSVQDAFNLLGSLFPKATSATDPLFLNPLNLYRLTVIDSGSWQGNVVDVVFNGSMGYLTLPATMQSIMGVDINGWPQMVFGQFHEYSEVGPGQIKANLQGCGPLIDSGDGFCTIKDITAGSYGNLRIKIQNPADTNKVIRFTCLDQIGEPIFDTTGIGFNVTTVNTTVTDTNKVSVVEGIQVQARMVGRWTLWWVSPAGVETQIGEYQPNELRPNYHRYKTGTWDTNIPIACKCRLRYLPVYSATDWVVPGNINAIKLGMQAIQSEANRMYGGPSGSKASWAECYALLNAEHKSRRGKAQYTVDLNLAGPGQFPVWQTF